MATELPDEWVDDPPSHEIAEILNATRAHVCAHGFGECFVYCGVRIQYRRDFLPPNAPLGTPEPAPKLTWVVMDRYVRRAYLNRRTIVQ